MIMPRKVTKFEVIMMAVWVIYMTVICVKVWR